MRKLLYLLVVILSITSCSNDQKDLNISLSKSQNQLVITNDDTFSYRDCIITINNDYQFKINVFAPSKTYNIVLTEFVKKDGTRFNPFTTKVLSVTVFVTLENEETGFYSGTFQ